MPRSRSRDPARVHLTGPFEALPGLQALGRSNTDRATPWLVHTHRCVEIHYLARGTVWCWHGHDVARVAPGQLVLALPGERHGSRYGVVGPSKLYWLLFDVSEERLHNRPLFGLPADESVALIREVLALPSRRVAVPRSLQDAFERALGSVQNPSLPLAVTRTRQALLDIVLTLIEHGARKPAEQSLMVSEAIRLMRSHLEEPLTPEQLCKKLGWSRSRLQTAFRAETGVPPAEYYLHLRVSEASERLQSDNASVTAIAGDLGFVSSQYFATAFKRVTGLSPQAFRRAARRHSARDAPAARTPEG